MKSARRLATIFLVMTILVQSPSSAANSDMSVQSKKIGLIVGDGQLSSTTISQARRLLEHSGLPYDVMGEANFTVKGYPILIFLGTSNPALINGAELNDTTLIWIGFGLTPNQYPLFGVSETPEVDSIERVTYNGVSTDIFDEQYICVRASGATVEGYLESGDGARIPAETRFTRPGGGDSYLFTYNALDYWNADQDSPWLRALRVKIVLEEALENHEMISLSAYPSSYQSAYITRIEDVDPLHTSPEWLSRANEYLTYYTSHGSTLTAALTPTYIDPSINETIRLEDPSASALRLWLQELYSRGGAIVEHGYTHQYDEGKTGVATELYDESKGAWLSLDEQTDRILAGRDQIQLALGVKVWGFEAPHYRANDDTYRALLQLGIRYTTHNTDTIYLDRENAVGLINIPETLGYIPNNPPPETEQQIKDKIDVVYEAGGVALLFNHLFQYEMVEIGEAALNYARVKPGMWVTNTDRLAFFWEERTNAYQAMTVSYGETITVTLGPSATPGLALKYRGNTPIESVTVNGQEWASFDKDSLVLPSLAGENNTIVIGFEPQKQESGIGFVILAASTGVSAITYRQIRKKSERETESWV